MNCRYCRGLTLIEMLATVAVVAIALSYTLSQWEPWLTKSRHRRLVLNYHEAFSFARWMAVSNKTLVTICPLSSDGGCVDNWALPVAIFPDDDNDKQPDNNKVWRFLAPPKTTYSVRSRTGGRGYLQFDRSGTVYGATGGLVICPHANINSGIMSYLAVNRGGRFRSVHATPGTRELKLRWGAVIQCP